MPIIFARETFNRFVDLIVDRIVIFTDYFIIRKYVTLSETALFMFCLAWFVWMVFVPFGVDESMMSRRAWAILFGAASIIHFSGFFLSDILFRTVVVCFYAFMWCCLAVLAVYLHLSSPAAPTLVVLSMMSVFIAVRLLRERRLLKLNNVSVQSPNGSHI